MAVGVVVFERHELQHTRATLQAQAAAGGRQYADTVESRLHAQFIELQFVAVTLLPPDGEGPPIPSSQTVRALRSFMALHPSLYAFNIQSSDGETIVWSTQAQSAKPITGAAGFIPLSSNPNFLLGTPRYAKRVSTYAITMRFRVLGPDGHVRYFVGTPYKLNQLLAYPNVFRYPWRVIVTDMRSGKPLARWQAGKLDFQVGTTESLTVGVRLPIGDTPLVADVQWPPGYAWSQWVQGGRLRWFLEFLLLAGFAGSIAGMWINGRRLIRQRAAFERASRIDPLTNLPNTSGFAKILQQLPPPAGDDCVHCVLVLDVYRFTEFNRLHDRDSGDAVLRQLAKRLQALPKLDAAARLEEDAFGLLWCDCPRSAVRNKIVQALLVMEMPFDLPAGAQRLSASVGCAVLPDDGQADAVIAMAKAAVFSGVVRRTQKTFDQTDPYGPAAADVLQWALRFLKSQIHGIIQNFYDAIREDPDNAAVLALLQPHEFDHLNRRQARYLLTLISPDLSEAEHAKMASRIGALHAFLGVTPSALVHASGWYWQALTAKIQRISGRLLEKQLLERVVALRVERDLMLQNVGSQTLQNSIQSSIDNLSSELMSCLNWFEALDKLMAALRTWPMLHSASVLKQKTTGEWFCKASTEEKPCITPTLDPAHPVMQALSGQRVGMPSLQEDVRKRLGETDIAVRSIAAIPLNDVNGHTLSVLLLRGRVPNQFDTPWMSVVLDGLQQTLSVVRHYIATEAFTSPVTQEQRAQYRAHLFAGGLRMFMQPLLNLSRGECTKVEALARLQLPDGTIVSPGVFLPLLGEQEQSRLFIDGLDLSLLALKQWEAQGLRLDLSINLPPHTLIDPDCPKWVAQALHIHDVDPKRLTLELLETSGNQQSVYEQAITKLHALGVQLAMDDLGSGYSSLQRLQRLPFDFIKIDQGLIRNLQRDLERGIAMAGGIVRLGKALNLGIVVEGVETYDLMELSAVLGADWRQGFEIAKPMPAEELLQWFAQHGKLATPSQTPTSLIGLLATHWLWEQGDADKLSPDPARAHLHCRVGRYIQQLGWGETEVARTHAAMHRAMQTGGGESSAYRQSKQAFYEALQRKIEAEKVG